MRRSRSKSTHINVNGKSARSIQFLKDLGLKKISKNNSVTKEETKSLCKPSLLQIDNFITARKLTKDDLKKLMEFNEEEINYIIKRISNKRKLHLMKLLEDPNSLEDNFEFVLSRKVSVATEYDFPKEKEHLNDLDADDGYLNVPNIEFQKKRSQKLFSKPPWVDENIEFNNKFCSALAASSSEEIKVPKPRKKRLLSKIIDETPFLTLISKMMFSFGDYDSNSNHESAKEIEKYLKSVWLPLIKKHGTDELNEGFIQKIYKSEIEAYK